MNKEKVSVTRPPPTPLILIVSVIGPGYSREEWTSVKSTLGLDFPNVCTERVHVYYY